MIFQMKAGRHTLHIMLRPTTPIGSSDGLSNLPPIAASFSLDNVKVDLKSRV